MEFEAFSNESHYESSNGQSLQECPTCGRNFNPDSLSRHAKICAKSNAKKRKVFDASKQRLSELNVKPSKNKTTTHQQQLIPKKNNWRENHANLVRNIRDARRVQHAQEKGLPLPPPPPPTINPDYIQCQYCKRRFNESAAERHINFCKEQHERLPKNKQTPNNNKTVSKFDQMKKYQVPKFRSRRSEPSSANTSPIGSANNSLHRNSNKVRPNSLESSQPKVNSRRSLGLANHSNYASPNDKSPPFEPDLGNAFTNGNDLTNGHVLRTGRNTQTYNEAQRLSGKQRSNIVYKNVPNKRITSPNYTKTSDLAPNRKFIMRNEESPPMNTMRTVNSISRFCHDCGSKYPVDNAKFCCECGVRRMTIS